MNNEFKGTSGPWKAVHSVSKDAWNVVGTQLGEKYRIAICPYIKTFFSYKDKSEARANATLIAKAPQLLEMLIKATGKLAEFRSIVGGHEDTYPGSPFDELSNTSKYIEVQIENLIKEATL